MKRKYIKPTATSIRINAIQIMAASDINKDNGENITDTKNYDIYSRDGITSPNLWDQKW